MEGADASLNLAVAAGAALAGGLIARRLRQSVLVGYIVAGLALSPLTPGPSGDPEAIERLADLGVILLMFGLGVQFSLRELLAARRPALGVFVQTPLSIILGVGVAALIGWSWREGLFLGSAAAICSSIVLGKLLEERGESDSVHGRVAIAWSLVQDLVTVALVVLLGALAVSEGNVLTGLGLALLKAGAFIAAMLVVGGRVLPWLLALVARTGSRELFILFVAVLSVGAAVLAEEAGLSLALGAFIGGMVVSESDLSYQALGEVLPVRDIFAALFFVAAGMLVDPMQIWSNPLPFVALVTLVLSKGLIVATVCALLGYPPRTAALIGAGLAPSAEFSFILARQGVEAGVLSGEAFSLVLAAVAVSTVLAPLCYAPAPALARWLAVLPWPRERALPEPEELPRLRNHVVICGGGRVGMLIAGLLRGRGHGYALIEMDRRRVERLRQAGEVVIYGNAGSPPVLAQASLETARTLVLTLPDPVATHQIIAEARRRNPRLDIVARAVNAEDAARLRRNGVAEAVVAERELALELARHALHRVGLTTMEIQNILQRVRLEGS